MRAEMAEEAFMVRFIANAMLQLLHRLAKQKVSFVFHSTKDLQKIPLEN